jgi:MFS transporter, ACS family, hexuronate transporter
MNSSRTPDELRTVIVLCGAVSIMAFDQISLGYLLPFIKPALGLSNRQVGMLASAYWITFALSSVVLGSLSDLINKRKATLTICLTLIALCSVLPHYANSFLEILAARAVLGGIEGAIVPISQSIVASDSAESRRATNMGIVGNFGANVMGMLVAPLAVVSVAVAFGWRASFLLTAAPAAISALLAHRYLRDDVRCTHVRSGSSSALHRTARDVRNVMSVPNIRVCAAICCIHVTYLDIGFTFLPLYLTSSRGLSPERMSVLMGLLGLSATVFGLLLPALSDRVGRKPVLIVALCAGVLCPIAALAVQNSPFGLATLMFIGWGISGLGSIFYGTVPSESAPPHLGTTAIGSIVFLGTLIGGVIGPSTAGLLADKWGLRAPLLMQIACSVACMVLATRIAETAPAELQSESSAVG